MRYHKYRGRFTDLAKHYKDLERENRKMKVKLCNTIIYKYIRYTL